MTNSVQLSATDKPLRFPTMSRFHRTVIVRALIVCTLLASPSLQAFDFNDVAQRAQALAGDPYRKPENNLPKELLNLGYDQYRDIRFNPAKAQWRANKLPFELQFLHPGSYYSQPVKINLITGRGVSARPFSSDQFDYGKNTQLAGNNFGDIGYAGFRVHFPINKKDYKDEVLVFQGASYFRALGKDQRYGLSARGVAIDTGMLSGEEFPYFTEFWIAWPRSDAQQLVIYALLDSRRATGAYKFTLKPGETTTMEVQSRLYLRENVGKLGIAPLTSMFFFGENQHSPNEDYRPEVHDSDGLLMQTGSDEWIWRPLVNPRRLLITSFGMQNPKGFGLMQRDRKFDHYEDLEARYDLRPSTWVTPKGNWGAGKIELVQIPSPDETNDNVVAYWIPDNPPAPGQAMDLRYTLSWQMDKETRPPTSYAVQSRRGHGFVRNPDNSIRMTVDFDGAELAKLGADAKPFGAISFGDNGELIERQVFRNEVTGGWRLSFRFRRIDNDKPVELRAFLRNEQSIVSETWSYILPP